MFLPSGNVYLFTKSGKGDNIMCVDYDTEEDFYEDIKRFFKDYDYDVDKYDFAIYVNDKFNQLYKINVSRETFK